MPNLSFNGITKPYITVLRTQRPIRSSRKHNLLTIPGRPGGFYQDTMVEPLYIPVEILIDAYNAKDYRRKVEEIAAWFDVDEPASLIMSDDPQREYFALVEGDLVPEEVVSFSRVNVTFICPDPTKYGIEKTRQFNYGVLDVNNEGTETTYGRFTIKPTEQVTYIDVAKSNGDFVRIGTPIEPTETPVERKTRKLWDEMNTLVGWANAASVGNGDLIGGTMKTNNWEFWTDDFGTGPNAKWIGPAKKKSLSEPIQDFGLEVRLKNFAENRSQIGRIEVALLDANNNQVARVMMAKYQPGTWRMNGRIRAGHDGENKKIIDDFGQHENTWTEFDGKLRVTRIGNEWSAYIGVLDRNGSTYDYDRQAYETWTDESNTHSAPVTQVQVYIARYTDHPVTTMRMKDIKVFRYNDNLEEQIPYAVGPEDEVIVDCENDDIFINGETVRAEQTPDRQRMSPFSTFFGLEPGDNRIYTFPESLETTMTFRERFK